MQNIRKTFNAVKFANVILKVALLRAVSNERVEIIVFFKNIFHSYNFFKKKP